MRKEESTTLPWSGKPETLKTPLAQSDELLERIEQGGSSAMSSLKQSANKLVECLNKAADTDEVVKISNSLASTIQTQTNIVKAMIDFKKFVRKSNE